jgi:sugar phosphate isomerase/epimerase
LPVRAFNMMLPGTRRILGPDVNLESLRLYMMRLLERAARMGARIVAFGSSGARSLPTGFDRRQANQQFIEFGRVIASMAAQHRVCLALEPLNRRECNFINSLDEAMDIVRAVDHPNFRCLFDSYHWWMENEVIDSVVRAAPLIRHVHLADKLDRLPPGESGSADYCPVFRVLKDAGYDGMISVESSRFTDISTTGRRVLEFLKRQWKQA